MTNQERFLRDMAVVLTSLAECYVKASEMSAAAEAECVELRKRLSELRQRAAEVIQ